MESGHPGVGAAEEEMVQHRPEVLGNAAILGEQVRGGATLVHGSLGVAHRFAAVLVRPVRDVAMRLVALTCGGSVRIEDFPECLVLPQFVLACDCVSPHLRWSSRLGMAQRFRY